MYRVNYEQVQVNRELGVETLREIRKLVLGWVGRWQEGLATGLGSVNCNSLVFLITRKRNRKLGFPFYLLI